MPTIFLFFLLLLVPSSPKLLKTLSAMVYQIEHFDKIISQIIADVESVSLIIFPKIGGDHPLTRLTGDKVADESSQKPVRKSSMRKSDSTQGRKSSKRDSKVVIIEPDMIASCNEYFDSLGQKRNQITVELRRKYNSIGPLLVKLESLILGTYSGDSLKMSQYYSFWERSAFEGLLQLVKNNLNTFIKSLKGEPIFQVDALLSAPDIVLRPTANEIYAIVFHSVKDFLLRTKSFRRWMHGSCIQFVDRRKDKLVELPSFFDDIVKDENVSRLIVTIQDLIKKLVTEMKQYLVR